MKYLVTGGCGFVGSHLADALIQQGHEVRVLDNLSSTGVLYTCPVIVGDVTDPVTVDDVFQGIDGCFHLAGVASVERSHLDWVGAHRTNMNGAVTVFDAARKHGRVPVVYASSSAVYGGIKTPSVETDVPCPLSAYGCDKLGSELHAAIAANIHRIPTCGLRLFNVYGPRQNSGVISLFGKRFRDKRPVLVYGDGRQSRDFIFITDVVRALLLGMKYCKSGMSGIFNVCTGDATSIIDLVFEFKSLFGTVPVEFCAPRAGEVRVSRGDPNTARQILGFEAEVALLRGLAETFKEPL